MPATPGLPTMIEGRVAHKANNALKITFQDGPGDPIAIGVQGAADGRAKKLGISSGSRTAASAGISSATKTARRCVPSPRTTPRASPPAETA